MNHIQPFPLRLIVLVATICAMVLGFPMLASSESLPTQADLGMDIADISDPFYAMPALRERGWCLVDGILSDLRIDLDNDGDIERLVVYFAPSVEPFDDLRLRDFHPPVKDLRMAVFEHVNGFWINQSDMIIEASLITEFANIRVSVWGDTRKMIYIHSSVLRNDSVGTHHGVLRYSDDQLTAALMLTGRGGEGFVMYRVDEADASKLHNMDSYERSLIRYPERPSDAPPSEMDPDQSRGWANRMIVEPVYDGWGDNLTDNIPIPTDYAEYTSLLAEQLGVFAIDDTQDTNPEHCTPVCSIQYIYPWGEYSENVGVFDFTGIRSK